MRRSVLAAALVVALTGALGLVAAPAALAAGTIMVTPATNLTDGQTVTVAGGGFAANEPLAGAQCKSGALGTSDCDTSHPALFNADGSGTYSISYVVRAAIITGNGAVDCHVSGACVFAVADLSNIAGTGVQASLGFAPAAPPQRGSITAPATVTDGALVSATGSGFAPSVLVDTALCAAGPTASGDCAPSVPAVSDGSGSDTATVSATATLATLNSRSIDCTAPGACVFAAWDPRDFAGTVATASVVVTPATAATVTVTPSTGLHNGDIVSVTASGLVPDNSYALVECPAGETNGFACDTAAPIYVNSDGAGGFTAQYAVHDILARVPETDCTAAPGACTLAVSSFSGVIAGSVPLSFVPLTPPQRGSISPSTATPVAGSTVIVTGSGFAPSVSVQLAWCAPAPASSADCDISLVVTARTDASGGFATDLPNAPATIATNQGTGDCSQAGECVIAAWDQRDFSASVATAAVTVQTGPISVMSTYTDSESSAVFAAAAQLGVSPPELQRLGAWGLAWIYGITGTGVVTPIPNHGTHALTTDWPIDEYNAIADVAASHGETVAELQKNGALLIALILGFH
jgi:hypothetical protein